VSTYRSMAKTPDDAPALNMAVIATASLVNFISCSLFGRCFMKTKPRIVQRCVGFIAVLSQFCDKPDKFEL
jgi:hypothetical protein